MTFTTEQQLIGKLAFESYNLTVCAVAGSGKTTTCKHIISLIPNKKILLLLYNKELAKETKKKLKTFDNVEVKTLHSFIQNKYSIDCSNDRGLYKLVNNNIKKIVNLDYDLIIIDEAQDLTSLMYNSIKIIIRDFNIHQIILLGDLKQCIYSFRGANPKYLENAEEYFKFQNSKWEHLTLSLSFRCPDSVTSIIRKVSGIKMESVNQGGTVEFCTGSFLGWSPTAIELVISKIKYFLNQGNYLDQIAILSYSCRHGNNPLAKLANQLTKRGFPIHFPDHDDREPHEKLIRGKIVFSTFHGFKGRERKMIILYGIDDYLERYMDLDNCPNILYVALTRCTDYLLIVNNSINNSPFFLNPVFKYSINNIHPKFFNIPTVWNVCSLSKKLSIETIIELENYFTTTIIQKPINKPFNRIVPFEFLYEDTSALLGDLVVWYYRYKINPVIALDDLFTLNKYILDVSTEKKIIKENIEIANDFYDQGDYLKFMAISINLMKCKHVVFPLRQIKNYDWINVKRIKKAVNVITETLDTTNNPSNIFFEVPLNIEYLDYTLYGYSDIIKDDIVYEIKFTTSLRPEHQIQLLLYMCMTDNYNPGRLINAMTGEIIELQILESCKEKIIESCFKDLIPM